MVKMLNAFTLEMDEAEYALAEILDQLDLDNDLLAHSAGVVTCHPDFVESGVAQAICEALPFDVVGCTTLGNAINGQQDTMMLALTVLTSDELQFSGSCARNIRPDNVYNQLQEAYGEAVKKLPGKPGLVLAYGFNLGNVGGEEFLDGLVRAVPDTPVFGTLACDHTAKFRQSCTIFNGETQKDALAFLLIHGDIDPKFYIAGIAPDKVQRHWGTITDSEGSLLRKVNNMSALSYLQSIGMILGNDLTPLSCIPFLVNYRDGTAPVARGMFSLTPDGYAVCGGEMPLNGSLGVGRLEKEDVLATAKQTVEEALARDGLNALFICSCMTHNMVLGTDTLAEMQTVDETVGGRVPYHLMYSGGEICPVYNDGGQPVNRFHNFTLVACTF